MKRFKKILIILLILAAVAAYSVRVWHVNSNLDVSIVKEYEKGEIVPYGQDFTRASNMIIDGYSVEVLDYNIYTKDEFVQLFDIKTVFEDCTKYICAVDIKIYNDNKETTTESGIFLPFIPLIGKSDYIMCNEELTMEVNENLPSMSFSLRAESNMDVKIAYEMNEPYYTDMEQIEKKDFNIIISEYPTRKVLHLR